MAPQYIGADAVGKKPAGGEAAITGVLSCCGASGMLPRAEEGTNPELRGGGLAFMEGEWVDSLCETDACMGAKEAE